MISKIIVALSALCSLSLFAENAANNTTIGKLNCEFVESLSSQDSEGAKYYTLSYPGNISECAGSIRMINIAKQSASTPAFIEKNGDIRSADRSCIKMLSFLCGYGESLEIILVANDNTKEGKVVASCVLVPCPLIAQDDKGHKIEVVATQPNGEFFAVKGSGFFPYEKLNITSQSCSERCTFPLTTDAEGSFYFEYLPAVIGEKEGPFKLTFKGVNMKPLKIKHYWGTIAFTDTNLYEKLQKKYPI